MRVKMLRTTRGSPDGIRAFTYVEGEVYGPESDPPMTERLATVLLNGSLAEQAQVTKTAPDTRETKVVEGPPERASAQEAETDSQHRSRALLDVGDLTVGEAIEKVRAGEIDPSLALAQERNGKQRSTLIGQILEVMRG